ncbi:class I SAM-dependent methyltransferase [Bacillus alveayuensis]|uniref:class I SAM-dependent methyltransferase n=1 Tax=Aeribacillus alveayuensis TaxID=279215 RepID=UPI001F3FD68F|nr:class I SAM-dependent methyltransferase [Bacillus alveayuensis]
MAEKEQIKGLLKEIKKEAKDLLDVMWSREEIMTNKNFINTVNLKIKNMLDQIIKNLYWYQTIGWKKFLPNREFIEQKEREERIKKEKERLLKWIKKLVKIDDFYFSFHGQLDEEKLVKTLSAYGYDNFQQVSVLDIGCRDGRWLRKFQDWGALPERLVGTDFYHPIVDQAKKLSTPGIQFIETYPDELQFEDQKFDIILMFGVLMHVLDESLRKKIGQELLRVLSNDGIVITFNLTKDAVSKLEPYLAYTSIGLEWEELTDIFPGCSVHFEKLSQCGLAVIRKNCTKQEMDANG